MHAAAQSLASAQLIAAFCAQKWEMQLALGARGALGPGRALCTLALPAAFPVAVNILEGLTKTRHPTAKAVTQTPAKQEVAKKRSCNADKPISICTNGRCA